MRRYQKVLWIYLLIFVIERVGVAFSNSVALLSDAGHALVDFLANPAIIYQTLMHQIL